MRVTEIIWINRLIEPDEAVDLVRYAVGGVCPFAIKKDVSVYLDISLKRFETVYPVCGSSSSGHIEEFEKYSRYLKWLDVCKKWND